MASQTINQTNITNITVLQPMATALGIGQLPAGQQPSVAVANFQAALTKMLLASWPNPSNPYGTNIEPGIMGPWSANVGGTAPACVVQQITQNFASWGLTVDAGTINEMAQEITTQVASDGGTQGTAYGVSRLGGATINWGVGYVTGPIADNPAMEGVVYVFAAAESY